LSERGFQQRFPSGGAFPPPWLLALVLLVAVVVVVPLLPLLLLLLLILGFPAAGLLK
jgi:hypothetical protein